MPSRRRTHRPGGLRILFVDDELDDLIATIVEVVDSTAVA